MNYIVEVRVKASSEKEAREKVEEGKLDRFIKIYKENK